MNRRRGVSATLRRVNMSLWLWPLIAVVCSYGVGLFLGGQAVRGSSFLSTLFAADASAGRTILTALVGGLVTALSVIFSLTITGLQTVHQQYSPRLLRNFIRDRATKVTLSVFAGTVAYMLAVLQAIPAANSPEPAPRLAILVGMFFFLACVGIVAYFAQHITNAIRVHRAMYRVTFDTHHAISLANKSASTKLRTTIRETLPEPTPEAISIAAWRDGYICEVDLGRLTAYARRSEASIRIRPMIGDYIVKGTPIAWIWSRSRSPIDGPAANRSFPRMIEIGGDRTEDTDISYGMRQLVDVAVRAMSPSLNDPYTAVQAIDHLTDILCRLARDGIPGGVERDESGALLVAPPGPDLADYVRLAVDQPRRYGGHEPAVAVRLLQLIRNVGMLTADEAKPWLQREVDRIRRHAEEHASEQDDLTAVHDEADVAVAWLHGRLDLPHVSSVRL